MLAAVIAQDLGVSIDTVRRDLDALAAEGAVRRVHGGALPALPSPPPFAERRETGVQDKRLIARAAAALIPEGQTILLGGGTTVLELARVLAATYRGTVMTTSVDAAAVLAGSPGLDVLLPGGTVHPRARSLTGAATVDAVRAVRADACVLGACSLHPEGGLTGHEHDEVAVERAMLEGAQRVIVLATPAKLGFTATYAIAPLERVTDLVVAPPADPRDLDPFHVAGLAVTIA